MLVSYGKIPNNCQIQISRASTLSDEIDIAGGAKALKFLKNFFRFEKDGTIEKREFRYRNNSKKSSFKKPYLQNGDLIIVYSSFFNRSNEVIQEITQPFTELLLAYGLLQIIID